MNRYYNGCSVRSLIDYSKNDHRFVVHKKITIELLDLFNSAKLLLKNGFFSLNNYSEKDIYFLNEFVDKRISNLSSCSNLLNFNMDSDNNLKLSSAHFCSDRFCSMCNWRRRLKNGWRLYETLKLIRQHTDYKLLFVSLTCRNCHILQLNSTINILYDAFCYLFGVGNKIAKKYRKIGLINQSRDLKVPFSYGAYACMETTRNFSIIPDHLRYLYDADQEFDFFYHPHIHSIILVDSDYSPSSPLWIKSYDNDNFSNLANIWGRCLLKYKINDPFYSSGIAFNDSHCLPSVDIRSIEFDDDFLKKSAYELCKYIGKLSDFSSSSLPYSVVSALPSYLFPYHWLLFSRQLSGLHLIRSSGLFRGSNFLPRNTDDLDLINVPLDLDEELLDLIHINDKKSNVDSFYENLSFKYLPDACDYFEVDYNHNLIDFS